MQKTSSEQQEGEESRGSKKWQHKSCCSFFEADMETGNEYINAIDTITTTSITTTCKTFITTTKLYE